MPDFRRRTGAGLAAMATLALAACTQLPVVPPAERVEWAAQNWTAEQRRWFHHVSQGTATLPLPYEWFMALEQPALAPLDAPGLFSDPGYLRRWGFIDSPAGADNPGGLPVGFARDPDHRDPNTGKVFNAIGLSCAACHTGQLRYRGTQLLVDGGPAMTDVAGMSQALGKAVAFTHFVPGRFDRFARRVLGEGADPAAKARLQDELKQTLATLKHMADLDASVKAGSVTEGFTRLDALNRIGNQVFALAAGKPANYHATDAPVNYPPLWGTSWYDWVQYNGSIMQPMVRNAGEALGVVAGVNLAGPEAGRFDSTVPLDTLQRIEQQLAGRTHPQAGRAFTGLRAPRWPEALLGAIDRPLAARGQALYAQHCQRCHLPAPDSPAFWSAERWPRLAGSEQAYLKLKVIPITVVGTDPMQARALADRTVDTRGIGLDTWLWTPEPAPWGDCAVTAQPLRDGAALPYGAALGAVVQQVTDRWYAQRGTPPAQRQQMDGGRPNCLSAAPGYKARPLDGIWATGPFLHNGSVPDLMALLSPAAERPVRFWLGNTEFDPARVGPVTAAFPGGFELDTTLPGNSNRGHEFDDAAPRTPGVIGPRLAPAERAALVEYLKTL